MTRLGRRGVILVVLVGVAPVHGRAADQGADSEPVVSGSAIGFYYVMRDQPDFGVGVAAVNRGPLRLEARYNYEERDAGSAFIGWQFAGGEVVTFEITPIAGVLFGAARGAIPGVEASVVYGSVDAYIEAEYVYDLEHRSNSYYYTWSEIGWKPTEWLRLGLAGQRTRVVQNDRELQRGLFAQLFFGKATLSAYAFNPDASSRYAIIALGVQF